MPRQEESDRDSRCEAVSSDGEFPAAGPGRGRARRRPWSSAWLFAAVLLAAVPPLRPQSVLIVYDGEPEASEAFKTARYVAGLLGHFELDAAVIRSVRDCPAGAVRAPDFVFVAFEEGRPEMPEAFLDDLGERSGPIVWIGMHIERLVDRFPHRWGFVFDDFHTRDDWQIVYKGEMFPKEDPGLNVIRVDPGRDVPVFATAHDDDGRVLPYALRSDNLWHFADAPFSYAMEGGRFLILADLLHDILGRDHPPSRRALVRIEDVNPLSDPGALRKTAALLSGRGIPFQVALIPFYRDPDAQIDVSLTQRPAVAAALRRMVERGGTIVLHGSTHQSRGATGDDYEFWDDITGVPITHETDDWVDQRLRRALRECARNGLHPLAWETPHYSASQADYRAFSRYFDVLNDRVMGAELPGTQQIFPYPARLHRLGALVVPENLGYVDLQAPDPEAVLSAARRMRVVRDGVASFFFHPFVPLKHLKAVVDGMERQGWSFVSLREFPCVTRTDSLWAGSASGEARITAANQYVRRLRRGLTGRPVLDGRGERREKRIVTEDVTLAPGEMFVLEAVDFLPPRGRRNVLAAAAARVRGLFGRGGKTMPVEPTRSLVVSGPKSGPEDDRNEASLAFVLRIFGLNPDIRDASVLSAGAPALDGYRLVAVPRAAAAALSDLEASALFDFVEQGGLLVADGRTTFAERLGVRFDGRPVAVAEVKDLAFPVRNLYWTPAAEVYPPAADDAVTLARDAAGETAVALVFPRGLGKVLFLAALCDPHTPFGTSRYAYLPLYLQSALGVPFNVRRNNLEFYFDPGFHPSTAWEKLVERWRESGVRVIYLAAWHFYRTYAFDYRYFVDLCHASGIAVYAWFEFPQVSPLFWDEHPEWREKTATGADGQAGWRLQMNLRDPDARRAILAFYRQVLMDYDWDGVNLAEIGFDTNGGAADPEKFMPMNAAVRREFRDRAGFDPIALFEPGSPHYWQRDPAGFRAFLDYRRELTVENHVLFLEEAERIQTVTGRDLEIIVTALDSLLHPEVVEHCGVDTRDIVGLMDRFPFTLQVEDPARSWAGPPSRYLDLYNAYKGLVPDERRLMFDINCIARDVSGGPLPSSLPTGTELAAALFYATFPSGRAGIYSEHTVLPYDMDVLPFVLGADVEVRRRGDAYAINAREPALLNVRGGDLRPFLDGEPWPFHGPRGVAVPSGRHVLTFRPAGLLDVEDLTPRMSFDGDVRTIERTGGGYRLTYDSRLPVTLAFNRPPAGVTLDGREVAVPPRGIVVLPKGRHELAVRLESAPSRAVGLVGYLSSSAFYLIGLLSVALLIGMYVHTKVKG